MNFIIPGWSRSGFSPLQIAATASNLLSDLPEMAHLISVGRCVAICDAVNFPV